MKATIKDVAEKAGVSIATVSRVINNSKQVSEPLREKVLAIIDELGYKPNPVARSLVMKKSRLIGVIVPEMSNFFIGEIMNGIEEMCKSCQYDIIVCSTQGNHEQEIRYLDLLEAKQAEGIIFMSWKLHNDVVSAIKKIENPVIMINRNTINSVVPSVSIDNKKAAYEMTQYLINMGHQKIALLRNSIDMDTFGLDQTIGYKEALADSGIKVEEQFIRYGDFSVDNSYKIVTELLEEGNLPTAIFATSDIMAIGAINAIEDKGYNVPDDISVVGFNDIKIASLYRPKLTVIHQPLFSIGTVAVKMIIDKIDGYELKNDIVILPHKLIERDSCKKIEINEDEK